MSNSKSKKLHKDLKPFRDRLDAILAKAEPVIKLHDLIVSLRQDLRQFDKDLDKVVRDHPDMCDSACPDDDYCSQQINGECPIMKRQVVSMYWGDNSVNTIGYLIGGV